MPLSASVDLSAEPTDDIFVQPFGDQERFVIVSAWWYAESAVDGQYPLSQGSPESEAEIRSRAQAAFTASGSKAFAKLADVLDLGLTYPARVTFLLVVLPNLFSSQGTATLHIPANLQVSF